MSNVSTHSILTAAARRDGCHSAQASQAAADGGGRCSADPTVRCLLKDQGEPSLSMTVAREGTPAGGPCKPIPKLEAAQLGACATVSWGLRCSALPMSSRIIVVHACLVFAQTSNGHAPFGCGFTYRGVFRTSSRGARNLPVPAVSIDILLYIVLQSSGQVLGPPALRPLLSGEGV